MQDSFDSIRKEGRLLYNIVRGSHLYNLNTEKSDVDYGGVFICKPNSLLGLGFDYNSQVSDVKHDNTWYEIGNFLHLLIKSNPTIIEYLFAPKDKIIGDVHPLFMPILDSKEEFITKQLFNPLFGYAVQQIKKAKGLNKLINWDKEKITRKIPFDFCYTFKEQGSTKLLNYLNNNGLKQNYCGLVSIPNMHDVYGVYYDFGNHFINEKINIDLLVNSNDFSLLKSFIVEKYNIKNDDELKEWFSKQKQIGYRGIFNETVDSNELRLSSVSKDEIPICYMTYNETGYRKHCIDYKNYKTWEKERNPVRYNSNLNKNYDAKNISHCVRLIHVGIELAKGEGFNVVRTWDRDFLLKIKNHGFEYDEIMSYVEEKNDEFNEAIKTSNIKEKIDVNFINDLLIEVRKKQLKL